MWSECSLWLAWTVNPCLFGPWGPGLNTTVLSHISQCKSLTHPSIFRIGFLLFSREGAGWCPKFHWAEIDTDQITGICDAHIYSTFRVSESAFGLSGSLHVGEEWLGQTFLHFPLFPGCWTCWRSLRRSSTSTNSENSFRWNFRLVFQSNSVRMKRSATSVRPWVFLRVDRKTTCSLLPSQTSPSSPRSQRPSPFRNSVTMCLTSRFSPSRRSTKRIPVVSQTSDLVSIQWIQVQGAHTRDVLCNRKWAANMLERKKKQKWGILYYFILVYVLR